MSDGHVEELLSAHLDGELTVGETAAVVGHLAECEACRGELEATRAVRTAIRAAPVVDPPFGFLERLVRTRRRPRWPAAASAIAVAAAWVVVVGFAVEPQRPDVTPPVDALRREVAAPGSGEQGSALHRVDPQATPLPASVLNLPRSRAFTTKSGKGTLVVFGEMPVRVVVYIERGDVDWSALQGGLRRPVSGVPGNPWESTNPDVTNAFVYEVDGITVIVVGGLPHDQLEQIAREVGRPSTPSDSVIDRLRQCAASVLDGFSLR